MCFCLQNDLVSLLGLTTPDPKAWPTGLVRNSDLAPLSLHSSLRLIQRLTSSWSITLLWPYEYWDFSEIPTFCQVCAPHHPAGSSACEALGKQEVGHSRCVVQCCRRLQPAMHKQGRTCREISGVNSGRYQLAYKQIELNRLYNNPSQYVKTVQPNKAQFPSWQAWRIKEDLKKVIYAILRCPAELVDLMKEAGDLYKWEHGGASGTYKPSSVSYHFHMNIYIYTYTYIYITIHFNIYWLYIYTYTNIVLVQTYQLPPLANLSFAPASLDHGIPSGWLLCAWPLPLSPNCAGFLVAICQGRHGIGLQVGAGPMTWYHPRPSAITHSRFLFLSLD